MDLRSYTIIQKGDKWIVSAGGRELLACADKRTATTIAEAAAKALEDHQAEAQRPSPAFAYAWLIR